MALLVGVASADKFRRTLQTHDIVMDKELFITATEVVDSELANYPGPWSFGHLVEEAFGEKEAPHAVGEWLQLWADGYAPEGRNQREAPARPGVQQLIEIWKKRDHYQGSSNKEWVPNLENAPFRLLSIVNRMDLAATADSPGVTSVGYYTGSPGIDSLSGEGRLVFGAIDEDGEPLDATFIFEYGLDRGNQSQRVHDWAMVWHDLGSYEKHDAAYRGQLAKVTRLFTDRRKEIVGQAGSARPITALKEMDVWERLSVSLNASTTQLIRVRSSERAFGKDLEFRQWDVRTGSRAGQGPVLRPVALPGTPREKFYKKGSRENRFLVRWLRDQRGAGPVSSTLRDSEGSVPVSFGLPATYRVGKKREPVAAVVARIPDGESDYHWDGRGLNDDALRRAFSTQTCVGCHGGDTNTQAFHCAPRQRGSSSLLSNFMRMESEKAELEDPATGDSYQSAEMQDRVQLFRSLLNPDLRLPELRRIRASRVH